jgi:hypothetical protein
MRASTGNADGGKMAAIILMEHALCQQALSPR